MNTVTAQVVSSGTSHGSLIAYLLAGIIVCIVVVAFIIIRKQRRENSVLANDLEQAYAQPLVSAPAQPLAAAELPADAEEVTNPGATSGGQPAGNGSPPAAAAEQPFLSPEEAQRQRQVADRARKRPQASRPRPAAPIGKPWYKKTGNVVIMIILAIGLIGAAYFLWFSGGPKPAAVVADPCALCTAAAQQYEGAYVVGGVVGDRTIIKEASCSGGPQCGACIVTVPTYGNGAPACMTAK